MSELRPGGGLVRTWAIRSTMHTIPSKEYYVYVLGGAGERMLNWIESMAKKRGYPGREVRRKRLYEPVLEEMKGEALTGEEVKARVSEKAGKLGIRRGNWSGIGDMAFQGLLVHAGKRGSKSVYMRSDDWIPGLRTPPDPLKCRAELLRKYISSHGPVSKEDIQYWAYLNKKQVDDALAGLGDEIAEVEVKGSRQQYFSLAGNVDREATPPPTALVLPKYDSLLMALKDKSRFMDMRLYKRVFGALGMVRPTVLVNGFVVAIWRRLARKNGTSIEVHSFKKVSNGDKQAVEERFSDYGKYAGLDVSVSWVRGKWVYLPSR